MFNLDKKKKKKTFFTYQNIITIRLSSDIVGAVKFFM